MAERHTLVNLTEVEDVAPANGFAERWEARVAREALDAEQTGLAHFRLLRPPLRGRRRTRARRLGAVKFAAAAAIRLANSNIRPHAA
jgi:hypothetical protein